MPISNADRQRRYREKRKAAGDLLERLNRALLEGQRDGERDARARIQNIDPEVDAAWAKMAALFDAAEPSHGRTAEQWMKDAYESGHRVGEHTVLQARLDILTEASRENKAKQAEAEAQQPRKRRGRRANSMG